MKKKQTKIKKDMCRGDREKPCIFADEMCQPDKTSGQPAKQLK